MRRIEVHVNETIRITPGADVNITCTGNFSAGYFVVWSIGDVVNHVEIGSVSIRRNYSTPETRTFCSDTYIIDPSTGHLSIKNSNRHLVESYACDVYSNETRKERIDRKIVQLRLDYSLWFDGPWSLFFGSLIMALAFSLAFLLLNLVWVLLRKIALWWIRRLERHSRVRAMIAAIEKYRQRQMETLHEKCNRKLSSLRENYHTQIDQLRHGTHLLVENWPDTLRDNYNQQVNRMRDFGSRRAERIWEGYDRQMNKIKTFTLQQRLRICNQYKVKQRYVNKLLEAISDSSSSEYIRQKETALRSVLEDLTIPSSSSPLLIVAAEDPSNIQYIRCQDMVLGINGKPLLFRSASLPDSLHVDDDDERLSNVYRTLRSWKQGTTMKH